MEVFWGLIPIGMGSKEFMARPLRIALVEGHDDLRDLYVNLLATQCHEVKGFARTEESAEFVSSGPADLLILDPSLPGEDGFGITQRLRETHSSLYILMLSARTSVANRINGYAAGADVYLSKPVSPEELVAAVGSIARRRNKFLASSPGR